MSIPSLIFERLCQYSIKAGLNPNHFNFKVEEIEENKKYSIHLNYIPNKVEKTFQLRPYYEAGATSEYLLNSQIANNVMMFIESIKPREEWPNDQSKLEGNQ